MHYVQILTVVHKKENLFVQRIMKYAFENCELVTTIVFSFLRLFLKDVQ